MKLIELARLTEDGAREHLERVLWPNGPVCPHCKRAERLRDPNKKPVEPGKIYRLEGETNRAGLYKCATCREPFSVTVGTVMESSHVPLVKWLVAFHLMASSKKGMSAHQLHRTIGVTYKTAWFMAHRIRVAMQDSGAAGLSGIVEVDETYVGGKPRYEARQHDARIGGPVTKKTPVAVLVERNGKARALALKKVNAKTLRGFMKDHIVDGTRIMTDESRVYQGVKKHFGSHETVNHSKKEYARGDVTTNSAEGFFALVKRQHYGTNHHYSVKHLPAYITETEFRWNARKISDEERRDLALEGIAGKRLMYKQPC